MHPLSLLRAVPTYTRVCSASLLLALILPALCAADAAVEFTITPDQTPHTINPLVFGANTLDIAKETTWSRHGGNRATGYNWETNASHAGTDWKNNNDFLGIGAGKPPATGTLDAFKADHDSHRLTMLTLQLAGYVSADGNGPVDEKDAAPSARFKKAVINKGKPLAATPDLTDDSVYMDEQLHFLITKLGTAKKGGVTLWDLDNEPALWPSTHPRIHPAKPTYKEVADKNIEAATMILGQDPDAQTFGPVSYGWMEYLSLQDAADAKDLNKTYGNFTSYYLDRFHEASTKANKRLLTYYDFHWYPEARGEKRITEKDALSQKDCEARMQAVRSLWDPTYKENSWIVQTTGGEGIALIPRFQKCIDKYYPGTKISFSEYNFGGADHISGAIAQADLLGALARYDCAGAFWPLEGKNPFIAAGFKLWLNYDGQGSTLGDTILTATTSDNAAASIYAARDAKRPQVLKLLLLNKRYDQPLPAKFSVVSPGKTFTVTEAFRVEGAKPDIQPVTDLPKVQANKFAAVLPPMSATIYILKAP